MRALVAACVLVFVLVSVPAATTYVVRPDGSGDFRTIQLAVDHTYPGDIIELTDGEFLGPGNCDIDFRGRVIAIRSQSGVPEQCVINCNGSAADPHTGFLITDVSGWRASLQGVHVKNGYYPSSGPSIGGGAVFCRSSMAIISNCLFTDCYAARNGGGVCCSDSQVELAQCRFTFNESEQSGGGLHAFESVVAVHGCRFEGNHSHSKGGAVVASAFSSLTLDTCEFYENTTGGFGGAVEVSNRTTAQVLNCLFAGNATQNLYGEGGAVDLRDVVVSLCTFEMCTFWGNSAHTGAAIYSDFCQLVIANCTLYGNAASEGGGIYALRCNSTIENTIIAFSTQGEGVLPSAGSTVEFACTDLYGNAGGDWIPEISSSYGVDGNISEDPIFCDAQNADFHLAEDSPCAPFSPPNPECDLIGAWPVACGSTPVVGTSWGGIRMLFRGGDAAR